MNNKKWLVSVLMASLLVSASLLSCRNAGSEKGIRIGYINSPLLAPLFLAQNEGWLEQESLQGKLVKLGNSEDIGYALLAGSLDVGFIEPEIAEIFLENNADQGFKLAGTINFPYGAALVVRKDVNVRLTELAGMTIAADDPGCSLLEDLKNALKKLNVDIDAINFVYIEEDTMLPGLEAGKVDGIITKSSYSWLAQQNGHKILYQNWQVKPSETDVCCALYIAHVDYYLIVRDMEAGVLNPLLAALDQTNQLAPEKSRQAIVKYTGFPGDALEGAPVANFSRVSDDLKANLNENWIWNK
ncbi:MAG TPA: ABC transporter substrate-binding protein [Dehalococcoidales bacterium]|nr:ABC transporter substrate-binding protein [Dehalococcoidales bacterium]